MTCQAVQLALLSAHRPTTANEPLRCTATVHLSLLTPHWAHFHFSLHTVLTWKSKSVSRSVVSNSLQPQRLWPTRLLCPWTSPGKNTGVGCHSLLRGIFPTEGWNLHLLHCRQILHHLSHLLTWRLCLFAMWAVKTHILLLSLMETSEGESQILYKTIKMK